jgi:hypothetical protein
MLVTVTDITLDFAKVVSVIVIIWLDAVAVVCYIPVWLHLAGSCAMTDTRQIIGDHLAF